MRKKQFLLLLYIIAAKISLGQVNLQTGSAEQSFPLINYSDSKSGLTLGVSANYASGNGLLVNDIASDLGTGWALEAGGMISRIQIGQPDDQIEHFNGSIIGTSSLENYPNGYMYSTSVGKGCNEMLNYYPVFGTKNIVYKNKNSVSSDNEQDRFIFRFNGRTGVFIIGRDRKVTTIGDSRMRISFTTSDMKDQHIRTRIDQFIITTEDGVQYTFKTKGLTHLCRYKYTDKDLKQPKEGNTEDGDKAVNRFYGFPIELSENPFIVNSWFLTEIKNTNNSAKISFEYEGVINDIITDINISQTRDLNSSGKVRGLFANHDKKELGRYWFSVLSNPANAIRYSWNFNSLSTLKGGPIFLQYIHSIVKSQRLTKIVLPNGGFIQVKYNPVSRVDLPGEHAISKIEYILNGKLLRAYQFEYGYFFKNIIRPYTSNFFSAFESKFARLCLLSIQKMGSGEDNAEEPPYQFTYYHGSDISDDIVPARNFLSKDHWGYYNGNVSGLPLSEDHNFLSDEGENYFKTVLPTMHTPKDGYAKNGLLHTITYPTGGTIEYFYKQNILSSPLIIPNATSNSAGGVCVSKTIMYNSKSDLQNIVNDYNYVMSNGVSSRWGDETPAYTLLSQTDFRETFINKIMFHFPGIEYPEMAVSSEASKLLTRLAIGTLVGLAASFGVDAALTAIGISSYIPFVNVVVTVLAVAKIIYDLAKTFEFHRFILTNTNSVLSTPLTPQYSRVEVRSNSPNTYNGKTVYEFTDFNDHPLISKDVQWPFPQKQRAAAWAYGLLKKVTVYNNEDNIVSERENNYQFYQEKIADENNISCNCTPQRRLSLREWEVLTNEKSGAFSQTPLFGLTPIFYYSYTGRTDLTGTRETKYVNGKQYSGFTSTVINDPGTLLQKGTIISKDGSTLIKKINYYANDYAIPGALEKLKANNAIHTPVTSETWMLKVVMGPGNKRQIESYLVDASVTEYKLYSFTNANQEIRQEVKPWKTYSLKTETPIPASEIGAFNPSVLINKPQYYKLTSEMLYDSDGNLMQVDANDQVSSYVYDHDGRYVIASVANCLYKDIAYTSFEADGMGKWIFDQPAIRSEGISGSKSFDLGFVFAHKRVAIQKSNLDDSKTYIITYWKKGNSVTVNDQNGAMLFEGPDGWKLYKHEVTNTTLITISGDALIDELRLYPKGALMGTVTYKEGIGKITECDVNNRFIFYEYDSLGRLKLIRDQNKNIIKTYEYNYKK